MTLFVGTLLLEWVAGLGILATTKTRLPKALILPLGLLVGMFLHNLLFFGVDLLHLGFSNDTLLATGIIAAIASNAWIGRVRSLYAWLFSKPKFSLRMYDVVALAYAVSIGYYVVWAAWYWPVTPFDAMAGIDLVAREAVNQGTINNRVFTDASLAGFLSNQPFYAPFAMLMQVMYRLVGFTYGQVWLGIVAIATSWFFWAALRQFVHPFIANVLWMLLILTPELLGYTYLLQTDYLNAAYLSIGVASLAITLQHKDNNGWWASAIMLAGACWSRTESILLVGLGLVACVILWRAQAFKGQRLMYLIASSTLGVLCFWLWNGLYLQSYLPTRPDTASQLIGFDFGRFLTVTGATFTNVIADSGLWGLTFILFGVGFIANLVSKRSVGNIIIISWIAAIFLGLLIVGTVFSAAIVEQTLRRGMFKLVPLAFLYVAALPLVQEWGTRLQKWERKTA